MLSFLTLCYSVLLSTAGADEFCVVVEAALLHSDDAGYAQSISISGAQGCLRHLGSCM